MFSGIFAFILWIVVLIGAIRLVNALAMREINQAGILYRRAECAPDYWFEMIAAAAVLLYIVACLLGPPMLGGDGRPINAIDVILPALLVREVARAFRYGRVKFLGTFFVRTEKAREYWTVVLVEAAITAMILALMISELAPLHPRA
ncbi:MAG TPA: hypothetical protein VGC56_00980 [Allosphingosinicella sp.]|jgi:hypothetical protein